MLRQMERSAMQLLHKRGKSQRQIARELGHSRMTVARALQEPVDRRPAQRRRPSIVDPYREQIERWVKEGLTAERMLELARADPAQSTEAGNQPAQQGLLAHVVGEPDPGPTAVLQTTGQEVSRAPRGLTEGEAPDLAPVDLQVLAREALEPHWHIDRGLPLAQALPMHSVAKDGMAASVRLVRVRAYELQHPRRRQALL